MNDHDSPFEPSSDPATAVEEERFEPINVCRAVALCAAFGPERTSAPRRDKIAVCAAHRCSPRQHRDVLLRGGVRPLGMLGLSRPHVRAERRGRRAARRRHPTRLLRWSRRRLRSSTRAYAGGAMAGALRHRSTGAGRRGIATAPYDGHFGPTTVADIMRDFYGVVRRWLHRACPLDNYCTWSESAEITGLNSNLDPTRLQTVVSDQATTSSRR